jgi:hypothetical protein
VSDAIFVGQTLLDRGVFRHVVEKKKPFLNELLYYRFIEDDEQSIRRKKKSGADPLVQSFVDDAAKWERLVTLFRQKVRLSTSSLRQRPTHLSHAGFRWMLQTENGD